MSAQTTAPAAPAPAQRGMSGGKIAAITAGSIVGVLVITIGGAFITVNSAQVDGTDKETALSAQYKIAQNQLSTTIGKAKDSLGLAKMKGGQIDQILSDTMKGRYASEGNGGDQAGAQFAIKMITEAYPDLSGLSLTDDAMRTINQAREDFKNEQSKLLDMLRDFDKFRNSGLIHKKVVSMAGIPDDSLKAGIGNDVVFGRAAENRMWRIVLTKGTEDAYKTGQMPDLTGSIN